MREEKRTIPMVECCDAVMRDAVLIFHLVVLLHFFVGCKQTAHFQKLILNIRNLKIARGQTQETL
jgi:hypothetical protein